MAKWTGDDDEEIPEPLTRFALADWPGADDADDAVKAWSDAGRDWISRTDRPPAWAADGGPIDFLCASIRLRQLAHTGVLARRTFTGKDLAELVPLREGDVLAWLREADGEDEARPWRD